MCFFCEKIDLKSKALYYCVNTTNTIGERSDKMIGKFSSDKAIYLQIIDIIIQKIIVGEYPLGSKLPTVRELASQIKVNPNTVQRAFTDLEELGVIFTKSTNGRFVSEDEDLVKNFKDQLANQTIDEFFHKMELIGFSKKEVIEYLKKRKGEDLNGDN